MKVSARVIADDCSTDDTRDVIRRYWESNRDRIRAVLTCLGRLLQT